MTNYRAKAKRCQPRCDVDDEPIMEAGTCSICGVSYKRFGNNAQPINDGRCCDECNGLVIAKRIQQAIKARKQWMAETVQGIVRKGIARQIAQRDAVTPPGTCSICGGKSISRHCNECTDLVAAYQIPLAQTH